MIVTRDQLAAYIKSLNLIITRNGNDYIGMQDQDGKHFRIRFGHIRTLLRPTTSTDLRRSERKAARSEKFRASSRYVYLLLATNDIGDRCGYVGSAINIAKRLKRHAGTPRVSSSSWDLHQWANGYRVPINVLIVDHVESHRLGFVLEGLWTKVLERAGVHLPAVERWLAWRRHTGDLLRDNPNIWLPDKEYLAKAQQLSLIMEKKLELNIPKEPSPLHPVASLALWSNFDD